MQHIQQMRSKQKTKTSDWGRQICTHGKLFYITKIMHTCIVFKIFFLIQKSKRNGICWTCTNVVLEAVSTLLICQKVSSPINKRNWKVDLTFRTTGLMTHFRDRIHCLMYWSVPEDSWCIIYTFSSAVRNVYNMTFWVYLNCVWKRYNPC